MIIKSPENSERQTDGHPHGIIRPFSNGRIKSFDAISGDYQCQIEFYQLFIRIDLVLSSVHSKDQLLPRCTLHNINNDPEKIKQH